MMFLASHDVLCYDLSFFGGWTSIVLCVLKGAHQGTLATLHHPEACHFLPLQLIALLPKV